MVAYSSVLCNDVPPLNDYSRSQVTYIVCTILLEGVIYVLQGIKRAVGVESDWGIEEANCLALAVELPLPDSQWWIRGG